MNETKKIIAVFVVIAIAIALVVGISVSEGKKSDKKLQGYLDLIDKKETQVIFLGRPSCSYCVQFTPIIDALKADYNFKYQYINTDDFSSSNLSKLLANFNIDEENFGTPYLVITKNGKVLGEQSGYVERKELFEFLQKNGVINENAEYKEENANLTNIDYARYSEILKNNEKAIVVLGQTGCSYCAQTKPVLNQIAEESNLTINYLNMTDLSEEDSTNLMTSTTYLKELESLGTPLTLIIENGQVKDHIDGYNDKSSFESFFRDNGFME